MKKIYTAKTMHHTAIANYVVSVKGMKGLVITSGHIYGKAIVGHAKI